MSFGPSIGPQVVANSSPIDDYIGSLGQNTPWVIHTPDNGDGLHVFPAQAVPIDQLQCIIRDWETGTVDQQKCAAAINALIALHQR